MRNDIDKNGNVPSTQILAEEVACHDNFLIQFRIHLIHLTGFSVIKR